MSNRNETDILYLGFVLGHGGDALQMLELACGMQALGKRVKVMVPRLETSESLESRCQERGIDIERTSLMRADQFAPKHNLLSLCRLFARNRAAILHIHTGDCCLPRSVVLAAALFRGRGRVFATLQSPYDYLEAGENRTKMWVKATKRVVDRVFCPSKHSREAQLRYGVPPGRVTVIHNSVDVAKFGAACPEKAFATLGVLPQTPLVVFSSRLEPQKRPQDALSAFLNLADKHPEARLVFVGDGTTEAELKATSKASPYGDRVHFVGYQRNIPDWLHAATVWTFPTESENFSLALLEALAAGCPTLSTMCAGNDEVLIEGENALTTAVGDVKAQTIALDLLLSDAALRKRLSEAAKKTAQDYSGDRMTQRYNDHYCSYFEKVR